MARVHRVDWRALGLGFLDEPERGATPLAQQLHFYDAYFAWGMDPARYPLVRRALRWLHANQPGDEPVALCWGDSRLANQIFDAERCVAILDWEMVRLGNPVDDLAWWIALDRCFSEGIDVPRLPGLPGRSATIERWQTLTGHDARDVAYYEVLGLCKFSLIIARIGLQMKHYGLLPEDHEMDVENFASKTLARALAGVGARD